MKRLFFCVAACLVLLTSCEMTREISINKDGSGTFINTTDMSGMISMAMMSGGAEGLDKVKDKKIDTTITLGKMADSIPNLSNNERDLLKTGVLKMVMDVAAGKMNFTSTFNFKKPEDLVSISNLTDKAMGETMKAGMSAAGDAGKMPTEDIPNMSVDQYFVYTYKKGLIECRLDTVKYANLGTDETTQSMKEISNMGMGSNKTIIRLPSKAKSVEGKNATLSEDKMTVTIETSLEDFFEDAKELEYKIVY